MTYKVVNSFFDKEDKMRLYEVDQTYPRTGVKPSKERTELLTSKGFIKEVQSRKKVETKKSGE